MVNASILSLVNIFSGEREELRRTVQHLTGSLAGLGQVFSVTASGDYRLVT